MLLHRHLSTVSCKSKGYTLVLCTCPSLIVVFLVLKPRKVFPWGILGERCFCRRIHHPASCGIPHGDQRDRTNGCDSLWGGFSTTSNPATKLWALQKTGFPHDFQTTGALAHESMTTPFPQASQGGKNQEQTWAPPFEVEIWGLAWFTLKKKWQYQRIGHCTERLGKQRKTDFFFLPVNQWCIKNKPQTNFSKWYCRTLGTSSYWFQWHLLTLSRIFQLESSKLTVLRGRMLLQNHWCSRECVEEGWPFH